MHNDGLFLLLAIAAMLGSCTGSQSANKSSTSAQVGELPEAMQGDYDVFASNCSKCHDLERALTAPVTDHRHWDRYVAKMMRTPSSGISAPEAPHILRFLYWYTDHKQGIGDGDKATAESPALEPAMTPQAAEVKPELQPPAPAAEQPTSPGVSSETQGESTP